jgi:hypothetical protein
MNKNAVFVLVAILASGAHAQNSLKSQLQGKYNAVARAMTVDVDRALSLTQKLLTSDFQWVDTNGNEFAAEPYMGSQSKLASQISRVFSASNSIVAYKQVGLYVYCRTKSTLKYRREGFSKDRNLLISISDDIWVKTIHGWKLLRTTSIRDIDEVVGRKVPSYKAAVMTARMTSAGVVQPAAALAFPSSSIVR